mmetsp:Transcript_10463/g.17332  ORF Transcript_10463/g.17332 Transcript_10463/m.17332 type:complete len:401 (-) Transcript_10463:207-1409(-)|eukprot:CAMPEP_0119025210 /NCGR_PEP_ID=MMETSP1176-20130426/33338_1 /TAXON_ID=265551 /ORGANISM="Synedropsis recta cf, Strain CCMP1620" /LENGTH=400 /DNA_ID=CAMNT_0006980703 /DNA_START=196 /DNA_END=1398 /DNA_ORIENTATION=-
MKISHHSHTIMLLAVLPLSLAREELLVAPIHGDDDNLLKTNADTFEKLFKDPTCFEYIMSHPRKTYNTIQVESTPINWGMHALQWKGYNHIATGGSFDPVLAQTLSPPAKSGSPLTSNSVSCEGADALDELERASSNIFKTGTESTDPNGTWNCAHDSDASSAAVFAAMNMFYWKTPVYVDMHADKTYPANSNFNDDEKEYYDHGCGVGLGDAFCESKIFGDWCKTSQPSGDPCGRYVCKADDLTALSPSCAQLGAVVIKSVELCVEGIDKPHVACNWDKSIPTSPGDWGTCNAKHLSVRGVVVGSFYNEDSRYPLTPNYVDTSQTFDRGEWERFYGHENGAVVPVLVSDPPAGTDMAALQAQAQRTTTNLLDSSAIAHMFDRRMNSKAGTIRGKDEENN